MCSGSGLTSAELTNQAIQAAKEGHLELAIQSYRTALTQNPKQTAACNNLGAILFHRGECGEARVLLERAVRLSPDLAEAHNNLGCLLSKIGQFKDALDHLMHAVRLNAKDEKAYVNIGRIWGCLGDLEKANAFLSKALEISPKCHEALSDLGAVCQRQFNFARARQCLRECLELCPAYPPALLTMAQIDLLSGRADEAIAGIRAALKANPSYAAAHSNLLLTMHYSDAFTPEEILEEHIAWTAKHTAHIRPMVSHANDRDPNRKLRVGYVSPDIRSHSVAYFLESLLDNCDRSLFEPCAYAEVTKPDEMTSRLKGKFALFRSTVGLTDEQVCDLIQQDEIDILVDLAGHTANNRLFVFARRPAPVQVTYLGYPDTTGMKVVDYRLTDARADPAGANGCCVEQLFRLDGFLCFSPPVNAPRPANPPCLTRAGVTFGSFNNLSKIGEAQVACWSKLLGRVEGARLFLKCASFQDPGVRSHYQGLFRSHGIESDRLRLAGWEATCVDHLALYHEIDIGLDTFPYNGATTTCEALYMGVPVISRTGTTHASRVGFSLLHQVGLDECVTVDEQAYIDAAVRLAQDRDRLTALRFSLRDRMAGSTLGNGKMFTRNMEQAFREMWKAWCQKGGDAEMDLKPGGQKSNGDDHAEGASSHPKVNPETQSASSAQPRGAAQVVGINPMVEAAIMADAMNRLGQRGKAFVYAMEGLAYASCGHSPKGLPGALLNVWQSPTLEGVLLRQCLSFSSFSSYFDRERSKQWLTAWSKLEPSNPEPFLRMGLLLSLEAALQKSTPPEAALKSVRYAADVMQDDRSAKALQLCAGGLKELAVPYDGGQIHVYPNITNISTYVLLEQGDWFEEDLDLFRALLKPGMRVLDLGANIGVYSFSAASRVGPEGRVVSVEPCNETYELLTRSSAGLSCWNVRHAAASEHSGEGCLEPGNAPELNKLSAGAGAGEKVKLVSVDDLAKDVGVDGFDLIKMDVEGHEIPTLRGGRKTFGEGCPIIFYEIKEGTTVHLDLVKTFKRMGYESYVYLPGSKALEPLDVDRPLDPFVLNAIAATSDGLRRMYEAFG